MEILVFKTNVQNMRQINAIRSYIKSLKGIFRWNFDLDDSDRILRVEAEYLSPRSVELALLQAGYYCEELED